jgi:hypothetical protein
MTVRFCATPKSVQFEIKLQQSGTLCGENCGRIAQRHADAGMAGAINSEEKLAYSPQ